MTHSASGLDPASAALIPPMLREEITTRVHTALTERGLDTPTAGAALHTAPRTAAGTGAAEYISVPALLHLLGEVGTDLGAENGQGRPVRP
ncbi:hypothetical protein [Kitasatospora cineracea]|uniref:Uncharacterized protein n=1 Tax=Kitasatospora cineracea TaxID=88074 RepID=A0A8G1UAE5_9ACTN|nr:hypothetical protein [Kitasatospora cineracea]ROR35815.1 hypothetical protein EDD39_7479 [Kitasatospora cineracea]